MKHLLVISGCVLIFHLLLCTTAEAQSNNSGQTKFLPDTSDLTINNLLIPASPAFNLMGISPAVIDQPKSPGDFLLTLNNDTNDFTKIPKSYAVEFSPAWVFSKNSIDFSDYISNRLVQNIKQSLVISFGYNPIDNPLKATGNLEDTQLGVGLKMSLIRGRVKSTYTTIDSMYNTLSAVNDSFYIHINQKLENDSEYARLQDSIVSLSKQVAVNPSQQTQLDSFLNLINVRSATVTQNAGDELNNLYGTQLASLKAQGSALKFTRHGFQLDFAAGFVTDFMSNSFATDSTNITNVGAWLTGGWSFPSKNNNNLSSLLGVLRLTNHPNQMYASGNAILTDDNLFLDYGARLVFYNGDKLSLSGEFVGRTPLNNDLLTSASRYTFNFDYQISKSITLSLNLGKDFSGVIDDGGNLLTAFHLFHSLGNRVFDAKGDQSN